MSDVEYVVNFGSDKSIQFVRLSMAEVEHHGARLDKEIVRCRDCRHMFDWAYDQTLCEFWAQDEAPVLYPCVKPDGFCAWGESREP